MKAAGRFLRTSVLGLLGTLPVLTGCSGTNDTGQAVAALGVAVAATAVHRAATDDCVGRCSEGYACNEKTGLCERGECAPSCTAGTQCTVVPSGYECRSYKQPYFNPMTGSFRYDQDGNAQRPEDNPPPPPRPNLHNQVPPAPKGAGGQVQIKRGNPGAKQGSNASGGTGGSASQPLPKKGAPPPPVSPSNDPVGSGPPTLQNAGTPAPAPAPPSTSGD